MKLTYRGISYDSSINDKTSSESVARPPYPSLRPSRAAYNLVYRGRAYRVDSSAKQTQVPVPSATHQLIYRGTIYLVNQNAQK
ncbi:MAG: DUF4278 domain-containing protein [Hydrococcus sp. Prado102]|jgi:hypothetical protein|nr:DUF4278 domain-containing protein [Hydrococcus sp. Prado102]